MQNQSQTITQFIFDALDSASKIALQYFRQPVSVEVKADDSPVTIADREIEQITRNLITERFPGHAIYGEEQGQTGGEGGTWVIDPIDGTKSFLLGNPLFGSLLGFVEDGIVQAGGLSMPALNEIWVADRSGPTTLNGIPCHTSPCQELATASLLTSSPDFFDHVEIEAFETPSKQIQ